MKRLACLLPLALGACVPGVLPVLPTVSFVVPVPPPPAALYPLDGRWVLASVDGSRACLVVQESRVSIVNSTCATNGTGFAARILESPLVSRAGQEISLSVTYNPQIFDESVARISFTGTVQSDGGFIGTKIETLIDPTPTDPRTGPIEVTRSTRAILSRT